MFADERNDIVAGNARGSARVSASCALSRCSGSRLRLRRFFTLRMTGSLPEASGCALGWRGSSVPSSPSQRLSDSGSPPSAECGNAHRTGRRVRRTGSEACNDARVALSPRSSRYSYRHPSLHSQCTGFEKCRHLPSTTAWLNKLASADCAHRHRYTAVRNRRSTSLNSSLNCASATSPRDYRQLFRQHAPMRASLLAR